MDYKYNMGLDELNKIIWNGVDTKCWENYNLLDEDGCYKEMNDDDIKECINNDNIDGRNIVGYFKVLGTNNLENPPKPQKEKTPKPSKPQKEKIPKPPKQIKKKPSKLCKYEACNTWAGFNIKGGPPLFCNNHKTSEMISVVNKRCKYQGCDLHPVFGIKGSKASFCNNHKSTEMIDVISLKCNYEGCNSQQVYGIKGGKATSCGKHKTSEMINLKHAKCKHEGCTSQRTFGSKDGKMQFCGTHKTDKMINLRHKKCIIEKCIIKASYGKPGFKISHCSNHKEAGMIHKPNSKCDKCKELAVWGKNFTPMHCEIHKTDDDENLLERPCSSCNLMYILDKTNKCEICNPESWSRAYLAKQNALMDYLDAHGLKGSSTDTIVDNGTCGKERPDRVYDFGDKIVILECDENQHQERTCICEQTRMVNIGQSFGGIPVYFIRWNPDNYKAKSHTKNLEVLAKRHKLCSDLIVDIKENKIILPIALVSAIYLYYDGWSSLADEKWQIITATEST